MTIEAKGVVFIGHRGPAHRFRVQELEYDDAAVAAAREEN